MDEDKSVNEAFIKMVNDLKSPEDIVETNETINISMKRSISSNSMDSSSNEETNLPCKRLKLDNTFDMSYIGSPRETRRLRSDLVEARNIILELENRVKHMHSVREECTILFKSELKSLRKQHEYDKKTIQQLEVQLQDIRKREARIKDELEKHKNNYADLKTSSGEQIMQLESEIANVRHDSQTALMEEDVECSALKRKVTELQNALESAQKDADAQRSLADYLGKELSTMNSVARELELKKVDLQIARNKIRQLENNKENYDEYQEQAKSQVKKLARYDELENENEKLKENFARLKDNLKNKLLLEEEVHSLKNRLVKHKELEKRVEGLQATNVQNEMYLNEWRALAQCFLETNVSDAVLPQLMRASIEKLQQNELTLTAEKIDFESQFKAAQHAARVAKSELEKNQKLIKELKDTGELKQTLIHRIQKKLLLVSGERDSYRLQLDSYEKDLTIFGGNSNENAQLLQSQKERIDNLEKIVQGYRDMIAKLENDLRIAQPQVYADIVPARAEQLAKLQDDVGKLREANNYLREHNDKLQMKIESLTEGDDTLQGGKVAHLTNNLLAEMTAQKHKMLELLQDENAKLKYKIKKLEEGIETSKLGDVSINPSEIRALKEQIKAAEKQNQNILEMFKTSMQDFANIIYVLFGYKISRSNNVYKLSNMYAEHETDVLCFKLSENDDLQLLETEFSASLESMIDLHLNHQKSIPVFLSALTIDLFNQTTLP